MNSARSLALACLPALALGCISVNLPTGQIEPLVETVLEGEGDAKVLVVEIDGVITEASEVADFLGTVSEGTVGRLHEELDMARSDDQVKALVLRINSPGGTVTGSDLIYDEIHYALHHHNPTTRLGKRLRELHMRHHFQDDEKGFGISAPYWDVVFRTFPGRRGEAG